MAVKKTWKKRSVSGMKERPVDPLDALLRPVDQKAYEVEARWGAGIVWNYLMPELGGKFIRALDALDAAIATRDYDTVKLAADNVLRGWQAVDMAVTKKRQGEGLADEPLNMKGYASDGVVYTIVPTEADAALYAAKYPHHAAATFTCDELANMLFKASVVNNRTPESAATWLPGAPAQASNRRVFNMPDDPLPF